MKLIYLMLFIFGSTFFNASMAESYRIISKDAFKAKKVLSNLRIHHVKFSQLLNKRAKVEAWEKKLKQSDQALRESFKEAVNDQAKVKSGKLSRNDFNLKWKATGKMEKTRQAIISFRSEIKKYNLFRQGYNRLANQLKVYLHKRKPKELSILMVKMKDLILKLDVAFKKQEYDKAVLIVSNSKIASEFGYKK